MVTLAAALSVSAQGVELSSAMQKYRTACLKMLDAVKSNDKFGLYDAKVLFEQLNVSDYSKMSTLSQTAGERKMKPTLFFCAEYVDLLIKNNCDYVACNSAFSIRNIIFNDYDTTSILVLHKALPARQSASFTSEGSDRCELMLVPQTAGSMKLTVRNAVTGKSFETVSEDGGRSYTAVFDMTADGGTFTFMVENLSDDAVSFVIAAQ